MKKINFTLSIWTTVAIIFVVCLSTFTNDAAATDAGQAIRNLTLQQVPKVYTVNGQELIGWEAVTQRDLACTRTIPVDKNSMININFDEDRRIIWHILINFKAKNTSGDPFGCFRLYEMVGQDKSSASIKEIDGGGFLINTCSIMGSGVTIDQQIGQAIFTEGQGYIQCKINIRQWVETLQPKLKGVWNKGFIDTMKQQTWQAYNNVVLYAQGDLFTDAKSPHYPILYYTPIHNRAKLAYPPVGMALWADEYQRKASLYSLLRRTNYRGSFDSLQCSFQELNQIHDWLMEFDKNTSSLTFAVRDKNEIDQKKDPTLCKKISPSLSPKGKDLNFWIDEATLDIGHWPITTYNYPVPGSDPELRFNGTLYEVLIDPGDSKPPRSHD